MVEFLGIMVPPIEAPTIKCQPGHPPVPTAKRRQHCTLCKNHNIKVLKNGHVCQLKTCKCKLCKLTTKAQIAMRYQQALWRHQGRELAKDRNFQMIGLSSRQLCDKCRNHNVFCKKRGHKTKCKYENCSCPQCNLTDKRRLVMKHQQRVRRGNITSHVANGDSNDDSDDDDDDDSSPPEDENSIIGAIDAVTKAIDNLPTPSLKIPFSPRGNVRKRVPSNSSMISPQDIPMEDAKEATCSTHNTAYSNANDTKSHINNNQLSNPMSPCYSNTARAYASSSFASANEPSSSQCRQWEHRLSPHHYHKEKTNYQHYPLTSSPHYPRINSPHYPRISSPHYPRITSPHHPLISSPHYPRITSPHYHRTSSPHYPRITSPHYPRTSSPNDTRTTSPQYPHSISPRYPTTTSPHYRRTTSPNYPRTTSPPSKDVSAQVVIKRELEEEEEKWHSGATEAVASTNNSLMFPGHGSYLTPPYLHTDHHKPATLETQVLHTTSVTQPKQYFPAVTYESSNANPEVKVSSKMNLLRNDMASGSNYPTIYPSTSSLSQPLANSVGDACTAMPRNHGLPTAALEGLSLFIQRHYPEQFTMGSSASYYGSPGSGGGHPQMPPTLRLPPQPIMNQAAAAASTLRNIIHPYPLRQFPPDLQWPANISPYHNSFNPLLHYSSVLLPRSNIANVDIQHKFESIYDKRYLRQIQR